jgi:hypothetical protein
MESCATYIGSVVITSRTSSSGYEALPTISLDRLEKIDGSLDIYNIRGSDGFAAPNLREVDNLVIWSDFLTSLTMPRLQYAQLIQFLKAPLLQTVRFDAGPSVSKLYVVGTYRAESVVINVTLAQDVGFSASGTTLFNISLTEVYDLNIMTSGATRGKLAGLSFPDLTSVHDMNCTYCSDISFPQLAAVNGSVLVAESQMALSFPNLAKVGRELTVRDSTMTKVEFPVLERAGSLRLSNNSGMQSLTGENFRAL